MCGFQLELQGKMAGLCERGNESLNAIKEKNFLTSFRKKTVHHLI